MNKEQIKALETIYRTEGVRALIDAACEAGTNHILVDELWSCAMRATFGPVGLHQGWTNEDGSPSDEALEAFPNVVRVIADANDRIPKIFALLYRRASEM